MKKWMPLLTAILIGLSLLGCDPAESMEVIINNSTGKNLFIFFDSEINDFDMQLNIETKTTKELLSFRATGGVILSFRDYDSIYVRNTSNEILKIFKEDTEGKNIYNVAKYWTVRETSKNHFVYTFEITNEDLGLVDEDVD